MIYFKLFIFSFLLINAVSAAELCILARSGKYLPSFSRESGFSLSTDWGHIVLAFKNGDERIVIQSAGSRDVSTGETDTEKIIKGMIKKKRKAAAAICHKMSPEEVKRFYEYIKFDAIERVYKSSEKLTEILKASTEKINSCAHTVEEVYRGVTSKNPPVRAFRTPVGSALATPKATVKNIHTLKRFKSSLFKKDKKVVLFKDAADFYKYYTGKIYSEQSINKERQKLLDEYKAKYSQD